VVVKESYREDLRLEGVVPIAKVMAHATVGYYFKGDPENGGEGLLIGLNHCQAYKWRSEDIVVKVA
jgi:hypothetical protein